MGVWVRGLRMVLAGRQSGPQNPVLWWARRCPPSSPKFSPTRDGIPAIVFRLCAFHPPPSGFAAGQETSLPGVRTSYCRARRRDRFRQRSRSWVRCSRFRDRSCGASRAGQAGKWSGPGPWKRSPTSRLTVVLGWRITPPTSRGAC